MATEQRPEIDLIANLVVVGEDLDVLFVRYDPDDERWWLPGEDLEPYEHPDERARGEMARFGLEGEPRMVFVESFRGRRRLAAIGGVAANALLFGAAILSAVRCPVASR